MLYTYDQIKPLILNEILDGIQLKVSFQAKDQDIVIEAIGLMAAEREGNSKKRKITTKKIGLFSRIENIISAFRKNKDLPKKPTLKVNDTKENRQKAALNAFESVAFLYCYDELKKCWTTKPTDLTIE